MRAIVPLLSGERGAAQGRSLCHQIRRLRRVWLDGLHSRAMCTAPSTRNHHLPMINHELIMGWRSARRRYPPQVATTASYLAIGPLLGIDRTLTPTV